MSPPVDERLELSVGCSGFDVSRGTVARLEELSALILSENDHQNLVSRSTIPDFWQRHIMDAAQLVDFAPAVGSWLDIGSGAGIPGLVIAILTSNPVLLVEPRRLRAEFLGRAIIELDLSETVTVIQARIEAVRHAPFDIITARAVASLDHLFASAGHLSHKRTIWVLPKGRNAKTELDDARRTWQGEFRLEPSRTDPDALIVVASRVRRICGTRGVA